MYTNIEFKHALGWRKWKFRYKNNMGSPTEPSLSEDSNEYSFRPSDFMIEIFIVVLKPKEYIGI